LNVQLDGAQNVISVNAESVGDLSLSVEPALAGADAVRTALTATARAHRTTPDSLVGSAPVLAIQDPRLMGGPAASPALVWRVEVRSNARDDILELVLVDAQNGRVVVQFNQIENVAPPANARQWVCDAANSQSKVPCTAADAVNNPGNSAIADVKNAFRFAEATYDFYARRFNRNSLDDEGLRLVSTVRYQDTPGQDYQNAFWTSDLHQMVYGKDFASAKDVVGHELSHGFTDFTSHLLYYYQSGAINESLSDIFGELVEQSGSGSGGAQKWLLAEDLPIGAIRNMKDPPQFNDPDRITSTLWTGDFSFVDHGGVHTNSGVGNKTAYLITDGDTFNGTAVDGIGKDKAAAIYYRVNAFLLQSGSDYADLGNALQQSCNDLIGTTPKTQQGDPSPSGNITSTNCRNVARAIAATELKKEPQFWAIPREARLCPAKQTPRNVAFERFEGGTFNFQPADNHWFIDDAYAASNSHSVGAGDPGQFDTSLTQSASVTLPANAFLRFAHFYNLFTDSSGASHAGGVVEYRVGSGAWMRVSPAMFTDNPYNATVQSGIPNPLAGHKAFSGFSGGWTSSRVDLSSLAGKNVRFRFRLATDPNGSWDSWILDDIRIYNCRAGGSPALASSG
jgi:hypothetical protein